MWHWLFSTEGFVPRAKCGPGWTPANLLLHNVSDVTIWLCYMLLSFGALILFRRWMRGDLPPKAGWSGALLWCGFIFWCGLTHLMERLMFFWPAYNLAGIVKAICAVFSVCAVLWLVGLRPGAGGLFNGHPIGDGDDEC